MGIADATAEAIVKAQIPGVTASARNANTTYTVPILGKIYTVHHKNTLVVWQTDVMHTPYEIRYWFDWHKTLDLSNPSWGELSRRRSDLD